MLHLFLMPLITATSPPLSYYLVEHGWPCERHECTWRNITMDLSSDHYGARRRWLVIFTPRPICLRSKYPVPTGKRLVEPHRWSEHFAGTKICCSCLDLNQEYLVNSKNNEALLYEIFLHSLATSFLTLIQTWRKYQLPCCLLGKPRGRQPTHGMSQSRYTYY